MSCIFPIIGNEKHYKPLLRLIDKLSVIRNEIRGRLDEQTDTIDACSDGCEFAKFDLAIELLNGLSD